MQPTNADPRVLQDQLSADAHAGEPEGLEAPAAEGVYEKQRAMELIGKKLLAAEALEGKFSSERLVALAGDDGLELSLARSLAEHGRIGGSGWQEAPGIPVRVPVAEVERLDRMSWLWRSETAELIRCVKYGRGVHEHGPIGTGVYCRHQAGDPTFMKPKGRYALSHDG